MEPLPIDVTLRDGTAIHIRAIRPDDRDRLRMSFHRLTARSIYLRFLTMKRDLSERELRYLTEVDFVRHAAVVATIDDGDDERIVGVGRFVVTDEATRRAEVAFTVADDFQGKGLGSVLFDRLLPVARDLGIREFEAEILAENEHILHLFRRSGATVRQSVHEGIAHVVFPIGEDPER